VNLEFFPKNKLLYYIYMYKGPTRRVAVCAFFQAEVIFLGIYCKSRNYCDVFINANNASH
jgi:hypothetical protein